MDPSVLVPDKMNFQGSRCSPDVSQKNCSAGITVPSSAGPSMPLL